ncbi:flagellar hook-length control protein FliK [Methylobacillus flagellatus]|uniref:flagellar hook-length control protein FliK n=1 Tax=Methylobacillus flagellatus TaxID=405 RepID=UPI002853A88C|nr:flagellar hook-length control protein FliK [Methylobacillus flagellatus]MDR5172592.1 flagellar hook-length control protein FliK [Methylobacillus flagellatus]
MQNIPVPNQAAILNNTAASAAVAKAAKQANGANDGPAFKDVLAKQVQNETRLAGSAEQALLRQRLQLQLSLGSEGQQAVNLENPELVAPELIAGQGLAPEDVVPDVTGEDVLQAKDATLTAAEEAPLPIDGQPTLAAVTPDVQRRPIVEVAELPDRLDVKREPVEWLGKGKMDDVEPEWDKAAVQATAASTAKVTASNEQAPPFADALEQVQQAQPGVTAPLPQAQQAQQAAAAMDVRSNQVPTPFGQPGWNQAIGQKVVWMAAGGEQTASLTLNPPDLGPLQVVIHVHNNQADTTFLSDQADVRRALEDGMDNLRQMMSESGLQLGQANVRSGQQEAQQQAAGMARSNPASQGEETSQVLTKAATVMGLVDTFA